MKRTSAPDSAQISVLAALAFLLFASPTNAQNAISYRGICDASAAVPLDQDHFIVADDEHNTLQIYRRDLPDPVSAVPVWQFLGTDEAKESDLEGSAVVGSRIYWISSHGTNKNGKVQERRRRFFATEIVGGRVPTVTPVGKPYGLLVDDLAKLPSLAKYRLADAAKLPPKSPGGARSLPRRSMGDALGRKGVDRTAPESRVCGSGFACISRRTHRDRSQGAGNKELRKGRRQLSDRCRPDRRQRCFETL